MKSLILAVAAAVALGAAGGEPASPVYGPMVSGKIISAVVPAPGSAEEPGWFENPEPSKLKFIVPSEFVKSPCHGAILVSPAEYVKHGLPKCRVM